MGKIDLKKDALVQKEGLKTYCVVVTRLLLTTDDRDAAHRARAEYAFVDPMNERVVVLRDKTKVAQPPAKKSRGKPRRSR